MPRGDGTGPMGQGPRTGRGRGFCSGFNSPGFVNNGFGRGRGFGFRQGFVPRQISESEEKEYLEQELKTLKDEMKQIEDRLNELKE